MGFLYLVKTHVRTPGRVAQCTAHVFRTYVHVETIYAYSYPVRIPFGYIIVFVSSLFVLWRHTYHEAQKLTLPHITYIERT